MQAFRSVSFQTAAWIALPVGAVAFAVLYVALNPRETPEIPAAQPSARPAIAGERAADRRRTAGQQERTTPDVPAGFRGKRHPAIAEATAVDVDAAWSRVGTGRDKLHESVPEAVYQLYRDLDVAQRTVTYTAADFSGFLPDELTAVGQVWALDEAKVLKFLRQFHPGASLRLGAEGRRRGPDGSVGLLRAMSPTHVEVAFRIHAEFNLKPRVWRHPAPLSGAWYTPACLVGRLVLHRTTGQVEQFVLRLPTEQTLNVHLTVGHPRGQNHDIVRVERMELISRQEEGESDRPAAEPAWSAEMPLAEASLRLKQAFYQFMQIGWVPVGRAHEVARESGKPILAMVLWGALDDQSC